MPRRVLVRAAFAAVCLAGAVAAVVTYVSQVRVQRTYQLQPGDYANALGLVRAADSPLNPSVLRDTAEAAVLLHTGRPRDAERVIATVARDRPSDVAHWVVLTRIQLGRGRRAPAAASYRHARQLDPHLPAQLPNPL